MSGDILIPIIALSIPIIIVPTALAFKHARYLREVEHAERIKAMELGRTLPGDEAWSTPGRIITSIGAGVPIAALFIGFLASQSLGFHSEIWASCGSVGALGVMLGAGLAKKHLTSQNNAESLALKPIHDPDAFDVVGRRG